MDTKKELPPTGNTAAAKRVSVAILAVLMLTSGAWAKADCASVDRISNVWGAYWSGKKLEPVLALYAPDAVFLPTSHARWVGLAEIRKQFTSLQVEFDPEIRLQSIACQTSGVLAYDSGQYEEMIRPVKGGNTMHFRGDYLFVFRRDASGWKILEQTFTVYDPGKP
jgi:ketosteroid isomerase-like protein